MKKPAILLSLVILMSYSSCKNKTTMDGVQGPPEVSTIYIKKLYTSMPVLSSGRLSTRDEIKLSFKSGGVIESVYVREGENVMRGQLLVRLRQPEFKAAMTQAELGLDKATRDFERIKRLYQDSVATLEQYQNSLTALELARQNHQAVTFNLEQTEIRAPAAGRILKRMAMNGEIIGAGTPVLYFGSTTSRWALNVSVSDRDAVRLHVRDSAEVLLDAFPNKVFKARISEISGMADPYTGTFNIELILDENPEAMSTGLIGKAQIFPQDKKWYSLIPTDALIEGKGSKAEIYLVRNNIAIRTGIEVDYILDNHIYTSETFGDHGEVIVSGHLFISDGMEVNPVPAH
jgi:RND family efflux transporter MFP subunit